MIRTPPRGDPGARAAHGRSTVTPTTSKRSSRERGRSSLSTSHAAAMPRTCRCLRGETASSAEPAVAPRRRVLTSTKTIGRVVADDEVDLAEARAVVAREHAEAQALEVLEREILAEAAEVLAEVAGHADDARRLRVTRQHPIATILRRTVTSLRAASRAARCCASICADLLRSGAVSAHDRRLACGACSPASPPSRSTASPRGGSPSRSTCARACPAFTIVGRGDAAVRESRERVHAALLNSGFEFPQRRITVNLAPAHLRKVGPGFDLATACGLLAASEQLPIEELEPVGGLRRAVARRRAAALPRRAGGRRGREAGADRRAHRPARVRARGRARRRARRRRRRDACPTWRRSCAAAPSAGPAPAEPVRATAHDARRARRISPTSAATRAPCAR